MIDLHCHLLPGLDDGPATLDGSLALARALAAEGVTTVCATPHQLGPYGESNSGGRILEALADFQTHLAINNIPLKVLAGADVRVKENLPELLAGREVLTLGDGGRWF